MSARTAPTAKKGVGGCIVYNRVTRVTGNKLAVFTKPPKKELPIRRNMILHGTDLTFGRRAIAMRVFLTLDAFHYLLSQGGNEAQIA